MSVSGNLAWYVARGSGFVSWLLIAAVVCLGIATSRRWHMRGVPRFAVHELHRMLGITFYAFTLIHIGAIWLDDYIGFSLSDLFVPFASDYRTLWMSLGIVAAELGLAVGASVWLRRRIGYRGWHVLHGLSYPIFLAALLHGLGTGSDTREPWALALYALGAGAVLAALGWRLAPLPALRRPVFALAGAATLVVLVWTLGGPLADGWGAAAGSASGVATVTSATLATTATATPAATPTPLLASGLSASISGQTLLSADEQLVLLRGATDDGALELALRFTNGAAGDGSGLIQLRAGDGTPVCSGTIDAKIGRTLRATCSGSDQALELEIAVAALDRQQFSVVLRVVG